MTDQLSATTPLSLTDVSTTIQAEAEAYRASMDAGLQVTHPGLSSTVNAAVTTQEDMVETIASANSSTAQADIHTAIATFDSAILNTTGLFGLNGPVNQVNSELGYVPHNLTAKPTATTIDNVSGTPRPSAARPRSRRPSIQRPAPVSPAKSSASPLTVPSPARPSPTAAASRP